MTELAALLRQTAMKVNNEASSPRAKLAAVDALYEAANRVERLERELTETAATLQTSMEFNERAHVLLANIGKVMADVTFEPTLPGALLPYTDVEFKPTGRHAEKP